MCMDFNELGRFVEGELPGRGVWFQSSPAEEGTTDRYGDTILAEGLAIRRAEDSWMVIYFTILEDELAVTDGGDLTAGDLQLYTGFVGSYDEFGQAKAEARDLVEYLPVAEPAAKKLNQDLIFEALDDLEDE